MMRAIDNIALILAIIGALNWGLVGIFQYDLVANIFGGVSAPATRVVYTIVALAGLWTIRLLALVCRPHAAYTTMETRAPGGTPRPV